MRWKALRNGSPQTLHMQVHQVQRPEDQHQPQSQLPAFPTGDSFGLLPWKVAMLLLPKADFAMGLDMAMDQPAPREFKKVVSSGEVAKIDTAEENVPGRLLLNGDEFIKWGRKGPKRRF